MSSDDKKKVALCVATKSSVKKISYFINNILMECNLLNGLRIEYQIIVCINGDEYEHKINTLKTIYSNCIFLGKKEYGKNDALNVILEYIRDTYDIIHLFDDDVCFKTGSIKVNIEELLKYEGEKKLVGSNFYGITDSKKKLIKKNYLLHRFQLIQIIIILLRGTVIVLG